MSKARNLSNTIRINSSVTVPSGDTASRPANPAIGTTRFNTDFDALENYTAAGWLKVSVPIPTLTSVSGTIYAGVASNLTLTGTQFGTSAGTVRFTSGATTKDVAVTPSSVTSATVTVPSEIYGLSTGATVSIKFINGDGGQSNTVDKTVVGLPTGGTIVTTGGYRYHTFTSSSSLVVPSGFSATAEYLIVAGGGGSGTGGGGAGGLLDSSVSITSGTYTVTVGAGGSADPSAPTSGSNSVFGSTTATGGGYGAPGNLNGASGGSGGGGHGGWSPPATNGGSGTSGQGNAGGNGLGSTGTYANGGGGGGASSSGANATSTTGGNGGSGTNWKSLGTSYAGGGGGASYNHTAGTGGTGGGGAGYSGQSGAGTNGTANTGGGGGGSYNAGANGGSGIVIVRYAL